MIGVVSYQFGGGFIESSESDPAANKGRSRRPEFEPDRSCLLLGLRELKFDS